MWTVQRRPDIAVLKAVGASSGYLVRDALAQALAVLAAGTVLGGAAGALGGGLASSAVPFELGGRPRWPCRWRRWCCWDWLAPPSPYAASPPSTR
ncbi:hypothetical protein GCM10020000_17860 [Streptomyces olivoverticillatus]